MKTIGLIGAMPSELADIRKSLRNGEVYRVSNYVIHADTLDNTRIFSVCSGIGKVNAALAAQILTDRFGAECLISIGVAGGMHPAVKVCDLVLANEAIHHDLLPRFLQNYPPYQSRFASDPALISAAQSACAALEYPCHLGAIVSGESFIASAEAKAAIVKEFAPFAVDMESAAIAQCAYRSGLPFLSIRCISDNADDDGEQSFDEFEKIAAARVADVVLRLAKNT